MTESPQEEVAKDTWIDISTEDAFGLPCFYDNLDHSTITPEGFVSLRGIKSRA